MRVFSRTLGTGRQDIEWFMTRVSKPHQEACFLLSLLFHVLHFSMLWGRKLKAASQKHSVAAATTLVSGAQVHSLGAQRAILGWAYGHVVDPGLVLVWSDVPSLVFATVGWSLPASTDRNRT